MFLRPSDDLELVLITSDLSELSVAKSLLDSEDILYLVTGEESARMLAGPLLAPLLGDRITGARLFVRREDHDLARGLLDAPIADPPDEFDP